MHTIKNETKNSIWVVCDNGDDIWHLSEVMPTCVCTTGQPNQRQFATKSIALDKIPEQRREVYIIDP